MPNITFIWLMQWTNVKFILFVRIPNKLVAITDVTPTGFNVVWTEEYGSEFVLSYDLVINSHGPAHDIKEGCPHETENTFSFTLGAGDENQVFVEGFPDFEYDVTLRTLYNLGSLGVTDESESLDTRTLTDAPEAPEDLLVDFVYEGGAAYNVTAFVTWTAPCVLNGALRSFGVIVEASFELGGETHTLEYSRDIVAASVNDVFVYELVDINPFFRYVISVNTLAAEEGPSSQIVITPPDICSCVARF